jgi:hypothetical protein
MQPMKVCKEATLILSESSSCAHLSDRIAAYPDRIASLYEKPKS